MSFQSWTLLATSAQRYSVFHEELVWPLDRGAPKGVRIGDYVGASEIVAVLVDEREFAGLSRLTPGDDFAIVFYCRYGNARRLGHTVIIFGRHECSSKNTDLVLLTSTLMVKEKPC